MSFCKKQKTNMNMNVVVSCSNGKHKKHPCTLISRIIIFWFYPELIFVDEMKPINVIWYVSHFGLLKFTNFTMFFLFFLLLFFHQNQFLIQPEYLLAIWYPTMMMMMINPVIMKKKLSIQESKKKKVLEFHVEMLNELNLMIWWNFFLGYWHFFIRCCCCWFWFWFWFCCYFCVFVYLFSLSKKWHTWDDNEFHWNFFCCCCPSSYFYCVCVFVSVQKKKSSTQDYLMNFFFLLKILKWWKSFSLSSENRFQQQYFGIHFECGAFSNILNIYLD